MKNVWWLVVFVTLLVASRVSAATLPPIVLNPGDQVNISAAPLPPPSPTPSPAPTPTSTPTPTPACDFSITAPANGALLSTSSSVSISIQATGSAPPGHWMNYYAYVPGESWQGHWKASAPGVVTGLVSLGPLVAGAWQLTAVEYSHAGPYCTPQSVTIGTADGAAVKIGPQISGIDGSAANLSGKRWRGVLTPIGRNALFHNASVPLRAPLPPLGTPDINPADYGHYNAPGGTLAGIGVIGGPLLDDLQAAQKVVVTQKSAVEINARCLGSGASDQPPCPHGAQNTAANNYFEGAAVPNPSDYKSQLNSFYTEWSGGAGTFGGAVGRIDGACPLVNPTTAEVLQWAANKWGINPLLLYAEAVQEGQWDNLALGDYYNGIGTSSGLLQVADRQLPGQPPHAWPGFNGASANLSRENSCFNADFYSAIMWAAFAGQLGQGPQTPPANIGAAVQAWYAGFWGTTGPGGYSDSVGAHLTHQDWKDFFQDQPVPY